jgi:hypothetical protein
MTNFGSIRWISGSDDKKYFFFRILRKISGWFGEIFGPNVKIRRVIVENVEKSRKTVKK